MKATKGDRRVSSVPGQGIALRSIGMGQTSPSLLPGTRALSMENQSGSGGGRGGTPVSRAEQRRPQTGTLQDQRWSHEAETAFCFFVCENVQSACWGAVGSGRGGGWVGGALLRVSLIPRPPTPPWSPWECRPPRTAGPSASR